MALSSIPRVSPKSIEYVKKVLDILVNFVKNVIVLMEFVMMELMVTDLVYVIMVLLELIVINVKIIIMD